MRRSDRDQREALRLGGLALRPQHGVLGILQPHLETHPQLFGHLGLFGLLNAAFRSGSTRSAASRRSCSAPAARRSRHPSAAPRNAPAALRTPWPFRPAECGVQIGINAKRCVSAVLLCARSTAFSASFSRTSKRTRSSSDTLAFSAC